MALQPGSGQQQQQQQQLEDAFPTDALEERIAGQGPDDFELEASFQDNAVVTVKSHLLSSFCQYLAHIHDRGANPALIA